MRGAADVANLKEQIFAETFFDVQVVIVIIGVAEILADGKNVVDSRAAVSGGTQTAGCGENRLAGDNGATARYGSNSVDGTGPCGIPFEAVGGAVRGAIIKERIQIRSVEINAESCANDEIAAFFWLISESKPGREIFKVFGIYAGDASTLEDQSAFAGNKYRKIFFVIAQRTFIVPTQTIVHGEFAADLPGILSK